MLHAIADAVGVVLCLDQRERDVGLEMEDIVGALGLAARDQLATHDDPALGEADLFADLRHFIPARLPQGGRYELGTDVAFAEGALVHGGHSLPGLDWLMCSPSTCRRGGRRRFQRLQPLKFLDDGTPMLGPRHRLGAAEANQPAEALLGVLHHQGLHPVPELLLASCDEYGRICNSERRW